VLLGESRPAMTPKATLPRKKSCNNCSKSKLRCDLRRPSCTRCRNRHWDCVYAIDTKFCEEETPPQHAEIPAVTLFSPELPPNDTLDFSNVHLICTVDAHRIRVRWLESLLPSIDQRPKPFQPATMAFTASALKSYPAMFLNNDRPPFIHWSQLREPVPQPLANCINIARMWTAQTLESAELVRDVIVQEMSKLFDKAS
jgi:hypothetical protein